MGGVIEWFEERGEIRLQTPFRVREYAPLTDDAERPPDENFVDTISGVAFAIEYCDSHGWMSTRTIRCLTVDPTHPACISAFCHVRDKVMTFRVDRIISIIGLRTARIVSSDDYLALLAPYLAHADPAPDLRSLMTLQRVARDGVFALLQVAMTAAGGSLSLEARNIVLNYARAEADAGGCRWPPFLRAELWIDNLSPPLEGVRGALARLLDDRDKLARVLPFILKIARCRDQSIAVENSLRDLMEAVRKHFRNQPRDFSSDLRAMF